MDSLPPAGSANVNCGIEGNGIGLGASDQNVEICARAACRSTFWSL
jgi:hypothetical protein